VVDCEPYFKANFNVRVPMPAVPKVSIIGAGGKVAKAAISCVVEYSERPMDLVLVSRSTDRIEGSLLDTRYVMSMPFFNKSPMKVVPEPTVTKNLGDIKDSNLIIVTASHRLSTSQIAEYRKKVPYKHFSPAERERYESLIGAFGNYDMINNMASRIAKEAPQSNRDRRNRTVRFDGGCYASTYRAKPCLGFWRNS